jgi:hypothetical protein
MNKITLGKNVVNGFFSVQDGDTYTLPDGSNSIVTASQGIFWTLRYATAEGKADYTRPPIPEWENIEGQSGIIHMINREYYLKN